MPQEFVYRAFTTTINDPLRLEHEAVAKWVEDALRSLDSASWYRDVELSSLQSGQILLDGKPEQAKRYVLAAVAQIRHWDLEADRVRAQAKSEFEKTNTHQLPGWSDVWGRRRHTLSVVSTLMRRTLPLREEDLLYIVNWCTALPQLSTYFAPLGAITRAVERYAKVGPLGPDLHKALSQYASALRNSYHNDTKRLATTVAGLLARTPTHPESSDASPQPPGSAVQPSECGHPAVLSKLKGDFGMLDAEALSVATQPVGPDHFELRDDSPLRTEHALLSEMFDEVVGQPGYHLPAVEKTRAGRKMIEMDPKQRGRLLLALAERCVAGSFAGTDLSDHRAWQARYAANGSLSPIAAMGYEFDRTELFDYLLFIAVRAAPFQAPDSAQCIEMILSQEEESKTGVPLTEGERFVLHLVRASLITCPLLGNLPAEVLRMSKLINDGGKFFLVPGEAWTDLLNAEVGGMDSSRREHWVALLRHFLTATSARPSDKWLKTAQKLAATIGIDDVSAALLRWFPLVSQGRTTSRIPSFYGDRSASDVMNDENATCLRGMLWICPQLSHSDELCRAAVQVALSAYKKVPGVGPRAVKVGNAAVLALSRFATPFALGQLALLKVRVKFGTAQKEIEKAFTTAAEALDLPPDQVEEMSVPSYGMEDVGERRETFADGEFVATVRVERSDVTLSWSRADGKPQKSVPAKVKSEHKDDLKELQNAAHDIAAMLPAQSERIDSMFLLDKSWPLATWRERYLDHPLVGTLARRLFWIVDGKPILFSDNHFQDVSGKSCTLRESATVKLWHPIGRPVEETLACRQRLEELQITQPFKQAHREVYLLTDAELATRTYSNRFAAHVIRQHQFNALCAARGWRNKLRLMVDDVVPPATRELPHLGLRAEFWIEGIGDNPGTDTNDVGVFLRVSTDQVRFYRAGAAENSAHAGGGGYSSHAAGPGDDDINEPIPLSEIPPLVFSEIMRDVDLFVGVASVGNDPNWSDGGPGGRYHAYWQSYSFGELTATAQTRKAVLERIIPRLKIADRCSFSERFLVVRGDVRTYKIHLGSGNILMTPNDQYLCIVPSQRFEDRTVFLPFEGDSTVSIILSKAFLLARDTEITDPTIVHQIGANL